MIQILFIATALPVSILTPMEFPETNSSSRKILKAFTQGVLLVAGFLFILFTESTKSSGVSNLPAGLGGVAHADAPVPPTSDSGSSSGK